MSQILQSEFDTAHELHKKWLSAIEGGVRMNFSGANLSGADLRSADLRSANLSGASLRSADLRSADLRSANLRSANLSGADLRSADLSGASLHSANLSGANLSGANLSGADLRSADLSGADLRSADLRSANLPSNNHYAQISFDGHGERGRKITVFKTPEKVTYSCGCFVGTEQELRDYIDLGAEQHRESRRYALTCLIGALEISERRKAV